MPYSYFLHDARLWRMRGSDARALAEAITDLDAKTRMLEAAVSCERMAECAEAWGRHSARRAPTAEFPPRARTLTTEPANLVAE